MNTSISQITGTCSSIMGPAILLKPVTRLVDSLCCTRPTRNNVGVSSLPLVGPTCNIIVFPKHTPSHARPFSRRCRQCACEHFVVRQESRVCLFCGESYDYEPTELRQSKAHLREFNMNASKRIVHFKNWIMRLQGKERCNISADEIGRIQVIYDRSPDSLSEYTRIKLAMKELGLQRYYNHVYYVMRQILGYSLVEFRKINEARLVALFMRIQEPFSRIRSGRTNMLSYQFLIRKFCELLGYSVAAYIPYLKSRSNLQRQDYEWKQICDALNLPFYPSV